MPFFWQKKFGFILKEEEWNTAWKTTKETRLRVLQWKILHNIYPTNIPLNNIDVGESGKCTFCPDIIDNIEHFFCECPIVVNFWKSIEQKVYTKTGGLRVELLVQTILFGLQSSTLARFKVDYINHFILVAKMCIQAMSDIPVSRNRLSVRERCGGYVADFFQRSTLSFIWKHFFFFRIS